MPRTLHQFFLVIGFLELIGENSYALEQSGQTPRAPNLNPDHPMRYPSPLP